MRYILDTHLLLWYIFAPDKLSNAAVKIFMDDNNRIAVSIASMWEISIKNSIGKLPLPDGLAGVFDEVDRNGFGIIGIDRQCLEIHNNLPLLHRDPFDRLLIATAKVEKYTILTADENIQKYDVPWVW